MRVIEYGCQVFVDGRPVGQAIDCYTPQVLWKGKVELGVIKLRAGKHEIKLQSVGKNPKSAGYMIGLDCYTLEPVKVK